MSASAQSRPIVPNTPPRVLGASAASYTRYIARQPILNRDQETHGYELLFRSGPENFFHASDGDLATCQTIDFSLLFGSTALTGGSPAFINCTRNILLHDVITLLPRDRVVIEVLEDVLADEQTLAACDRLRRAGYLIALDDYVPTPDALRLLPFADIVKVDLLATDADGQAAIAADMRRRGIRLVAEKVESREQYEYAMHLGYHYFQGYFFCKPQTISTHDIPSTKLAYVHVWSIANRDCYDVAELEQAILREPSLCYRLLRYLNSAAFGLFPIRSIRHALSLLGQVEIRKWVSIVVAITLSEGHPDELIFNTLVRARACESLASLSGEDTSSAFMVGLVSLMDAVLDLPMNKLTEQLPLPVECKDALTSNSNALGSLLQLTVCCERGSWEELSTLACEHGLPEDTVLELHTNACKWAREILQETRKPQ